MPPDSNAEEGALDCLSDFDREYRHAAKAASLKTIAMDTSGPFRTLHLEDGWYVVGEGQFVPVDGREEATALVEEFA